MYFYILIHFSYIYNSKENLLLSKTIYLYMYVCVYIYVIVTANIPQDNEIKKYLTCDHTDMMLWSLRATVLRKKMYSFL